MRIAITGGSGFIASHFVDRQPALGAELVLVDVRPPERALGEAEFRRADIRDAAALRAALQGVDAVLHLAAAHRDSGISRDEYFSVNEGGARALVEAMTAHGLRSRCNSSFLAVYGPQASPPDETASPQPATAYSESKLAAGRAPRAGVQVLQLWTWIGSGAVG